MSKSKKSTIVPTVGMILALKSASQSKKTGPAKVLQVDRDKGNVVVFRPGGRIPRTVINFDSLDRYAPFAEVDFPEIDFNESGQAKSALSTEPSVPRPTVAHEPPPPPPANDTTAAPLAKVDVALFQEAQRKADERVDRLESLVESLASTVANIVRVNTGVVSPTPPKTKAEEREEATNKQVAEEMPWAKPQLDRFIAETMEFVTFASQPEIDRALRPVEVFEQFSLWCEVNGLRVPFPKTVYKALLSDKRTSLRQKISSKEEKTPLAIRRQTRFGFDESEPVGKDVQAIMAHARRHVWPSLAESYRETIASLLLSEKVTKANIVAALDHIAAMPNRGNGYGPDTVLMAKHIHALVRIARAGGPAK